MKMVFILDLRSELGIEIPAISKLSIYKSISIKDSKFSDSFLHYLTIYCNLLLFNAYNSIKSNYHNKV
jgi:hypothetical protein